MYLTKFPQLKGCRVGMGEGGQRGEGGGLSEERRGEMYHLAPNGVRAPVCVCAPNTSVGAGKPK